MEMLDKLDGLLGIHHIAIVVPNIEDAVKQYKCLGFVEESENVVKEIEHNIYAKIIRQDNYVVELITPIDDPDSSPYSDLLQQKRYGLDHICYMVSSIERIIPQLKKQRFIPISQPHISGVWNERVVLLGNRKMGVIELIESSTYE